MTPTDLTRGSVARALFRLALPLTGAMFLETAFNIVNAVWVGRTGTFSFAAVNLASFPIWMLFALAGIVTTGTNAVVAQKLGAAGEWPEEADRAREAGALGLAGAILFGALQALVVLIWGRRILAAMVGSAPEMEAVVDLGYSYLAFIFLFAPVHSANEAISSVLRAYGDTRTPTLVYALGFAVNFVLDPLLIFGLGPFPALGILGAAIATNASFWVVLVVYTVLLARGRLVYRLPRRRPRRVDWPTLRRIVGIGLPPSLSSVVFCLVYMLLTPIISHFGPEAMAALGIGHRCESLSYLVCYGFSLATVTLVGQNVGAGRHDRAEEAAWRATGAVAVFTVLVSVTFWFAPAPLAALFTTDPAVLAVAVQYLRIIAVSQVFMGVAIVLEGAFAGAGHTVPPTLISVPTALLRVPAAQVAALRMGYGLPAVWWSISLLTVLRGVLIMALFRSGTWRRAARGPLGLEPQLEEIPPGPHPLEPGRGEPQVAEQGGRSGPGQATTGGTGKPLPPGVAHPSRGRAGRPGSAEAGAGPRGGGSMVLEIRAFVTRELYEEVLPRLEQEGFEVRGDLGWSDPDSDGEYVGLYLDYAGAEELPVDQFAQLVAELAALLEKGGPLGHINLVDPRHIRRRATCP